MIKSIRNYKKLENKKVLVRVDFNVPIKNGEVQDDFKIIKHLPLIKYLIEKKTRIILISHLGRPEHGKDNSEYSLKPVAMRLKEILKKDIKFVSDCIGFKAETAIAKLNPGEILMLENIRFEEGEKKNSKILAKKLAKMADIYVNEAFAVSHRKEASVSAIKNYIPSFAGFLLEKEIMNLNKIKKSKNLIVVIGGAKLKTKISLIKKFEKKAKKILIGGALANNFFASSGYEVGRSLVDKESIKIAGKLMKSSKNILLPIDVVVGNKDGEWKGQAKKIYDIGPKDYVYDIGPETIKLYATYLKKAQNIIWNGPLGMFENNDFKHGTLSIARIIASRSSGRAYGVVGGGETVEALKMTKMLRHVDWVSTGGGAMLTYLSGGKMPGLEGII